ncbi:hypothetical protein V1509DRAFT_640595 [Lipomyces kononenkoae]
MSSGDNTDPLIPPTVHLDQFPAPPRPSNPPTTDDLNRALLYKLAVENSVGATPLCATPEEIATVALYYHRVRERYQRSLGRSEGFTDEKFDKFDQRMTNFWNSLQLQVESTTSIVQILSSRQDDLAAVKQLSRQQIITFNRGASARNIQGKEVPYLDGTMPSAQGAAMVQSVADIAGLSLHQARTLANGHGLGDARTLAELQSRLWTGLGYVQAESE